MTIARRLLLRLAVPLLVLLDIGIITRHQMAGVEALTRRVAESRVATLARLGECARSFAEMPVNVDRHRLAPTHAGRSAAQAASDARRSHQTLQKHAGPA